MARTMARRAGTGPGVAPPRDSARGRARASYDGVAVAVPVTVPYVRYSTHGAHWFIGRAMDALVERSGIVKDEIDGLTISSFSLAPDTAVGVTQHLGLTPRWLLNLSRGTPCAPSARSSTSVLLSARSCAQ